MRIRKIEIVEWRNFRNITIDLPDDASLICLVGANGTGKTHILELISACAHHIGLSSGIEIPRGDPLSDSVRDFSIEFFLARGVSEPLDTPFNKEESDEAWDRTIRFVGRSKRLSAGGIADAEQAEVFAHTVVQRLSHSKEVHHLTLDADRAFPRRNLAAHELGELFNPQWHDSNWNKGRAFQTTKTLYHEWITYCLARENKVANKFYQEARRATEDRRDGPEFVDAFDSYRSSLREVMPHLLFAGTDQEHKEIIFDTCGKELRFDQLSGGEREIAFLIGQIDRFGLRNGIFLLDEPELHLNPDLVREWVTYLAKTVATGQVWLATHSLEAVEAAGMNSTILLERDPQTKLVDRISSLATQPVLSALSRAVGTPAFSITSLRFVFIEGEEAIGERERYRRVTGLSTDTRFIECGSCSEVIRRLSAIRSIAAEAGQPIRVAGVIDRDWRSKRDLDELAMQMGLIVLPVHEVENFFLHKQTIVGIAKQNGRADFDYCSTLRDACDSRAGGWIIQSALSDEKNRDISELPADARGIAFGLTWRDIESDIAESMTSIAEKAGFDNERKIKLTGCLNTFAKIYKRKRESDDLWKICEGKEIIKGVARAIGFADYHAFESAVTAYWDVDAERLPDEVKSLREQLISE